MPQPRDHRGRFGRLPNPESTDLDLDVGLHQPGSEQRTPSAELVQARRVMLVGLEVLSDQVQALTIIGAQAVFEQTRSNGGIPFTLTTDADTSLAPALIDTRSNIGADMAAAGFVQQRDRPGIWHYPVGEGEDPVGFDILAPSSVAGGGRGARIPGQDKHAVGRADGLELALLDRQKMRISALDDSGVQLDAYVAGPAAITCAKAYKLADRIDARDGGKKNRVLPKDAGDIWRMMAVSNPEQVRSVYDKGECDAAISRAVRQGRDHLIRLFDGSGEGIDLAVRDLRAAIPESKIRVVIRDWMSVFRRPA